MPLRFLYALALTAFIVPGCFADTPLSARLELVPAHVLPGIPVMFVVTVSNSGSVPAIIYHSARLSATDAHGITFAVQWGGAFEGDFLVKANAGESVSHSSVIPAGGTTALFVPIGSELLENGAFFDPRLSVPGTYDLQMTIGQPEVITNVARLTVDQPTGDDLLVWKALAADSGGSGWNVYRWIGSGTLIAKYPKSTYYHLLAFYRVASDKPEDMVAPLKAALAAGASGPIGDEFRTQIAYSLSTIAQDAANRGDFGSAEAALAQATELVQQVIDHGATEYSREKGRDQRDKLQATAAEATRKRALRPVTLWRPIKPTVQCREKDGQIRFGYVNQNDAVRLTVGKDNHFVPEPSDRGQPVQFASGNHDNAFRVALLPGEQSLTWVLDGASAVFSVDAPSVKKCEDDGQDSDDR